MKFRLLYIVLVALPTLRLVQGERTWPFLLWAGAGWLIALVALAVYAKRRLNNDPAPKTDLRLPERFHVPTGPLSPTGDEPKLFDGSREQWNALTDQERRYALVNMSEEEQNALSPPFPTSQEELDEKYGDWTNERLEEEAAFHAQIAQYLSEIVAHFEWRTDLDAADAEDRKAIEKESERLFGAEPTLYVPLEPALSRVEALHTAARRYCSERAALWRDRFIEQAARRARSRDALKDDWDEEFQLLRTHYRVLDAIGEALETVTPADSVSLDEVRKLLLAAAASAVDELPHLAFERMVMQDEGRLFAGYLQGLSDSDLARVEPLPFRRRLSEAESARLWAELKSRWGVKRGPVWYPHDRFASEEPPPHARAFDEDPFLDDELQRRLREVLAALGVSRLWELRAGGGDDKDYELDLALLEPVSGYLDLDERFWTDASFEWLIYASHEETVTIVGADLLSGLQAAWPAWRSFVPE